MMRVLPDGLEITGEHGRGVVRLTEVVRPWDDDVFDFACRVEDRGVRASASVRSIGGDGLPAWVASLAESYGGWDGVRAWESLERDLRIEATHDGRGHVRLRFVLRGPRGYQDDRWEASVCVGLDAGEDMRNLAAEIADFVLA